MSRIAPIVFAVVGCASLAPPARAQFVTGDLYVTDGTNYRIYRVEPGSWNITTFADYADGDYLNLPSATLFTPYGTLLCSNCGDRDVVEFDSQGNSTVYENSHAWLVGPFGENGLAYDAAGDLYVSDYLANAIVRRPADGGTPYRFADWSDGIVYPDGLAFAANGDLYVANRDAFEVLKIDPAGNATVFDTLPANPYSIVIRGNGDIYVATYGSPPAIYRYPGGDAAQRVMHADFSNNSGNVALQLSLDGTKLYFTSNGTGDLWEVDADTGAKTEVIAADQLPGALAITVIGARNSASWANYGAGLAGTLGVPPFTSQQAPVLGTTITLDLGNSLGQPTSGFLILGFQKANLHTGLGADLLVIPALLIPVTFSSGAVSFTGTLPNDPALYGLELDLQAIEADPGAVEGFSFTQGLELLLGW
jgi:streptogramin lyase